MTSRLLQRSLGSPDYDGIRQALRDDTSTPVIRLRGLEVRAAVLPLFTHDGRQAVRLGPAGERLHEVEQRVEEDEQAGDAERNGEAVARHLAPGRQHRVVKRLRAAVCQRRAGRFDLCNLEHQPNWAGNAFANFDTIDKFCLRAVDQLKRSAAGAQDHATPLRRLPVEFDRQPKPIAIEPHGLLEALEAGRTRVIEAVPDPDATGEVAGRRQIQRLVEPDGRRRIANQDGFDAADDERRCRVQSILPVARGLREGGRRGGGAAGKRGQPSAA